MQIVGVCLKEFHRSIVITDRCPVSTVCSWEN